MLKLLAKILDLAPSTIELVSGNTSKEKTIFIPLTTKEVGYRLKGVP